MADIRLPITSPVHAARLSRWYGGLVVLDALKAVADFDKLPGFALAMATVEREVATMHSAAVTQNLQALVRAGHDITAVISIDLEYEAGQPVLVVKPMDLADSGNADG